MEKLKILIKVDNVYEERKSANLSDQWTELEKNDQNTGVTTATVYNFGHHASEKDVVFQILMKDHWLEICIYISLSLDTA